jgi:hemerythrin-like domain-containing protein
MSTTIELLGKQHQEVLAQLAEVERRLQGGDHAAAAGLAAYLQREVIQHFALEEQALFPVLARHLGQTEGPLAVMNSEHASFRELLGSLDAAVRARDPGREESCAHEIIDLLRSHIAKEDQVLFPMALQLLRPDEQCEVDAQAAALETPAPPAPA